MRVQGKSTRKQTKKTKKTSSGKNDAILKEKKSGEEGGQSNDLQQASNSHLALLEKYIASKPYIAGYNTSLNPNVLKHIDVQQSLPKACQLLEERFPSIQKILKFIPELRQKARSLSQSDFSDYLEESDLFAMTDLLKEHQSTIVNAGVQTIEDKTFRTILGKLSMFIKGLSDENSIVNLIKKIGSEDKISHRNQEKISEARQTLKNNFDHFSRTQLMFDLFDDVIGNALSFLLKEFPSGAKFSVARMAENESHNQTVEYFCFVRYNQKQVALSEKNPQIQKLLKEKKISKEILEDVKKINDAFYTILGDNFNAQEGMLINQDIDIFDFYEEVKDIMMSVAEDITEGKVKLDKDNELSDRIAEENAKSLIAEDEDERRRLAPKSKSKKEIRSHISEKDTTDHEQEIEDLSLQARNQFDILKTVYDSPVHLQFEEQGKEIFGDDFKIVKKFMTDRTNILKTRVDAQFFYKLHLCADKISIYPTKMSRNSTSMEHIRQRHKNIHDDIMQHDCKQLQDKYFNNLTEEEQDSIRLIHYLEKKFFDVKEAEDSVTVRKSDSYLDAEGKKHNVPTLHFEKDIMINNQQQKLRLVCGMPQVSDFHKYVMQQKPIHKRFNRLVILTAHTVK